MRKYDDGYVTPEQHKALLADLRRALSELPTSGALDRGGRPYRAHRTERRIEELAGDPVGLHGYVKRIAHRKTSEMLSALVKANRLDLTIEALVADERKVYAPAFSDDDRAAAQAKLAHQTWQVEDLERERVRLLDEKDMAVIATMNERRARAGRPPLTPEQEASVLENRRAGRAA